MIETKNRRSALTGLVRHDPSSMIGGFLNDAPPRRSFVEEVASLTQDLDKVMGTFSTQSYPHYDIINHGDDQYSVDVAVAGFKKAELEITVSNGTLTVKGEHIKDEDQPKVNYIRQGIAKRKFTLELRIGDSVKVVGAELDGGMLHIDLLREVPEEKKPKAIMIK